jgi:hypothetical protein
VGGYFAEQCCPEKNCSGLDKARILDIGCLFDELPENVRKTIEPSEMCDSEVMKKLSECRKEKGRGKSKSQGKDLARRCSKAKNLKDIVKDLGRDALRAPLDSIRGLSKDDIKQNLKTFKDSVEDLIKSKDRSARVAISEIAQKLKDSIEDMVDLKDLVKHVSKKDFKKQIKDKVSARQKLGLDDDTKPEPDLPRQQNRIALKALLENKKPEDLTVDDIKSFRSIVRGMDGEDICDLNNNTKLDSVREMCRFPEWTPKQAKCIGKNLREGLRTINATSPMTELTAADVENMVEECFKDMDDMDLDEMDADTCKAVCTKLAAFSRISCFVPEDRLEKLQDVCLTCRGRASGEALDESDVDGVGQLLTAGDGSAIKRLKKSAIVKRVRQLGAFSRISKKVRDIIINKLSQEAEDTESETNVNSMRMFACLLPEEKRQNILEHIANLRDEIQEDLDAEEEAKECLSKEDRESAKADLMKVKECLKEAISATEHVGDSGKRKRRRRATKVYTCAEVEDMNSGAETLTAEEINAMDNIEFANCLSVFGQYPRSSNMLNTLLAKAEKAIKEVCQMSTSELSSLGTLAQGMSAAQFACANLESDETVSSLGKLQEWTPEQLEAAVLRYRTLRSNKAPTAFTHTDLVTLGHFLCGLTPTEIKSIPRSAYGTAAATIGDNLKVCSTDRLEALAEHAKHSDLYGPVTGWDSGDFSELGAILGGLSSEELKSVTTAAMEGWRNHAIKTIHPDRLKKLTVAQLSSLDQNQASQITTEQYNALSQEQKNTVDTAAGRPITDGNKNGNGNTSGAATMCVTIVSGLVPLMVIISQLFY